MLAFVQIFNHCDSQPLETLEWWLFLKTYVHLQASMSQVLHLSCPKISNFGTDGQLKSHIQADQYQIVPHSRQSKPTYLLYLLNLFFYIFKSFSVLLWVNFEHWITCEFCRFRCKSWTVYVWIIFLTFLWIGISQYSVQRQENTTRKNIFGHFSRSVFSFMMISLF